MYTVNNVLICRMLPDEVNGYCNCEVFDRLKKRNRLIDTLGSSSFFSIWVHLLLKWNRLNHFEKVVRHGPTATFKILYSQKESTLKVTLAPHLASALKSACMLILLFFEILPGGCNFSKIMYFLNFFNSNVSQIDYSITLLLLPAP